MDKLAHPYQAMGRIICGEGLKILQAWLSDCKS